MQNRAKIFMPFDALGGLKEAIKREEDKHENKYNSGTGSTIFSSLSNQNLNSPKETLKTLQMHEDGRVWLHTGDIGCMDEDGYVFLSDSANSKGINKN